MSCWQYVMDEPLFALPPHNSSLTDLQHCAMALADCLPLPLLPT